MATFALELSPSEDVGTLRKQGSLLPRLKKEGSRSLRKDLIREPCKKKKHTMAPARATKAQAKAQAGTSSPGQPASTPLPSPPTLPLLRATHAMPLLTSPKRGGESEYEFRVRVSQEIPWATILRTPADAVRVMTGDNNKLHTLYKFTTDNEDYHGAFKYWPQVRVHGRRILNSTSKWEPVPDQHYCRWEWPTPPPAPARLPPAATTTTTATQTPPARQSPRQRGIEPEFTGLPDGTTRAAAPARSEDAKRLRAQFRRGCDFARRREQRERAAFDERQKQLRKTNEASIRASKRKTETSAFGYMIGNAKRLNIPIEQLATAQELVKCGTFPTNLVAY